MAVNQTPGPNTKEQFPGPYFEEENPGPYFEEESLFDGHNNELSAPAYSTKRMRPSRRRATDPSNRAEPADTQRVRRMARRPGVRARARRMAANRREAEQGGVAGFGPKLLARIRAIQATATVAMFMTPFWFVILAFWGISILGIAAVSALNIFGFQLVDSAYAAMFVLLTGVLHWLTLFAAIITFWMMRVEVTTQEQIGLFALICGFAMLPVLQIIPWVLVWCVCMIYLQTGKKSAWV